MFLAVAGIRLPDRKLIPSRFLSISALPMLGFRPEPCFSLEISRDCLRSCDVIQPLISTLSREVTSSAMLGNRLSGLAGCFDDSENVRVGWMSILGPRQTSSPVPLSLVSLDLFMLGRLQELPVPGASLSTGFATWLEDAAWYWSKEASNCVIFSCSSCLSVCHNALSSLCTSRWCSMSLSNCLIYRGDAIVPGLNRLVGDP